MERSSRAEALIAALIRDESAFAEVSRRMTKDVFLESEYNAFFVQLRRYFERYQKAPTFDEFHLFVGKQRFADFAPFAQAIFQQNPRIAGETLREHIYQNYQKVQTLGFVESIEESLEMDRLNIWQAAEQLREIAGSTTRTQTECLDVSQENIENLYVQAREFRSAGTSPLCLQGITRAAKGGIAPGELLIYVCPPNRGKTNYLVNEWYQGLLNRETVAYLTTENVGLSVFGRLCQRILLLPDYVQRRKHQECVQFLKKFFRFVPRFANGYAPANTFTPEDLRVWLDEKENELGKKIDRLIIDYMSKLKKKEIRRGATGMEDRLLTDELRALGIDRGMRIITAGQTTRAGILTEKSEYDTTDETDMQGGFGQYETADIVLGLSETVKEKREGKGRVGIWKMREAGGRSRQFVVYIAPWLGLMTDSPKTIFPNGESPYLRNPDVEEDLAGLHVAPQKEQRRGRAGNAPPPVAKIAEETTEELSAEGVNI